MALALRRGVQVRFRKRSFVVWVKPDGGLKELMARVTMPALNRDGLIVLPPARRNAVAALFLCTSESAAFHGAVLVADEELAASLPPL